MNDPIVSPWIIYWLSILDTMNKGGFALFIVPPGAALLWITIEEFIEHGGIRKERVSIFRKLAIAFIAMIMIAILTPSRNTVISMWVASRATPATVKEAIVAGKDFKNMVKADIIEIIQAFKDKPDTVATKR